ncbi:tail terminator [Arthrobacter phage Kumotta]|uniref:Tail terminator n=1 Tax=Arthrobacter phage Kumotta TaxID=2588498 RepID=A0A4Y6EM23_9CAUD|nr:tail terminator [Arthrobacter phage Kumotta]QDF19522.1 tail terminator [Arthrobacter phage Kumotta]
MSWPDIEKALTRAHREDTGVQTGTKVPDNVETLQKFVRIARGPGTDDMITDSPTVDVECFSTDYGTAAALAEAVRQWFHALNGRKVNGVLVDRVRTAVAPAWVDYRNPGTNRFVASYALEHRQSD